MSVSKNRMGILVAGVATLLVAGPTAAAADPPQSGDPRATAYAGNAVTCPDAKLPGSIVTVTATHDGTYLDVTGIPAGTTVTGVVVKGGNAYNVYPNLGALPWLDLHAPLNASGKPAGISHWYACGTKTTTTTTTPTTTTKPTTTTTVVVPPTTTTTTKTTTATTAPTGGTTTTTAITTTTTAPTTGITTTTTRPTWYPTTTSPASGAVQDEGGLAETGFGARWLIPVGALLVIAGAATLWLIRNRRRTS